MYSQEYLYLLSVLVVVSSCAPLPKLEIYNSPGSPSHMRILAQRVGEKQVPFFWNGDTPWMLYHSLSLPDVNFYLEDRVAKKFNVVQTQALSMEDITAPNINGDYPFSPNKTDPTQPYEPFWKYVDSVMDLVEEKGFYNAIWPLWGCTWVSRGGGDNPPKIVLFNPDNAYIFGKFVGNRFKSRSNLIWVLGGDISLPVSPASQIDVYRALAEGIAEGLNGGERPHWNDHSNPVWKKQLMSLHPTSALSSSSVFENDAWLSFNVIQSGWKCWMDIVPLIEHDYKLEPTKPTFMGEGAYEWDVYTYCNMPNNTNDEWGVRFNAYWSVFSGGFGTTYGANHLYQFDSSWKNALEYPGAGQVQYLRTLMESHDWTKLVPDLNNTFVPYSSSGNTTDCALVIGTIAFDGSFGFVYNTKGIPFEVNLGVLASTVTASWMNPRNGEYSPINTFANSGLHPFVPSGIPGNENDWVLVLVSNPSNLVSVAY